MNRVHMNNMNNVNILVNDVAMNNFFWIMSEWTCHIKNSVGISSASCERVMNMNSIKIFKFQLECMNNNQILLLYLEGPQNIVFKF